MSISEEAVSNLSDCEKKTFQHTLDNVESEDKDNVELEQIKETEEEELLGMSLLFYPDSVCVIQ